MRVNGTLYDLDDAPKLDKKKRHSIEVVVDRFVVRRPVDEKGKPLPPEDRSRLSDSVETALKLGEGLSSSPPPLPRDRSRHLKSDSSARSSAVHTTAR